MTTVMKIGESDKSVETDSEHVGQVMSAADSSGLARSKRSGSRKDRPDQAAFADTPTTTAA